MATTEEFKVKVTAEGIEKLDKIAKSAEVATSKINLLAAGILGVGFGHFIKGAIEMSDRLSDLSDATGISIATIKGFEGALGAAGGKSRNTERAILGFVTAIETANDGSLKVRDAFKAVGVSLDDLKNLSESDLLLKTIEGLKGMEEGSARTSVQAVLLTKAFRGVDAKKFFAEFEAGKITSEQLAEKMRKLGDANDRMEKTFRTLQEGAVIALEPIIGLFGGAGVTAEAAGKMITIVGIALGFAFGASMLAKIIAVNEAILATAVVSNLLGKNPIWKLLANIGLAVAGGGAAWGAYELALSKAEEQQKKFNETSKDGANGAPKPPEGPAGRTQQLDPSQKAVIDSMKRIEQSKAETQKLIQQSVTDDIKNIRLAAEADIAKANEEINTKEYLSKTQKATEFAAKKLEIESKAEFDILKIREEVNKTYSEQLNSIRRNAEERLSAFELEKKFNGLGGDQLILAQQLLSIEQKRKQAVEEAAKVKNIDIGQLAEQINAINAQADAEKAVAEQRADWQRQFSTGWEKAFGDYVNNATNASNVAKSMFDAMTNGMNGAIDNFVENGKFSFSDFTQSIIKDIIKIQLKSAAANLFAASGIGTLFSLPGKASGGPVSANSPYIVGEQGPELFIPKSAGSIIPNGQHSNSSAMNGGGTTIINNISAIDSRSVAQLFAENRMTLFGTVEQARRELPMRTR